MELDIETLLTACEQELHIASDNRRTGVGPGHNYEMAISYLLQAVREQHKRIVSQQSLLDQVFSSPPWSP